MNNPTPSTFPIRLLVISACVASGWFIWYAAHWLVRRDAIYLRLHDQDLGFIPECAELLTFAGLLPTLLCSLLLGLLTATWLARRKTSQKKRVKNP